MRVALTLSGSASLGINCYPAGELDGALVESIMGDTTLARLKSAARQIHNGAEFVPGELRVKETERAIKETTV